ncbi:protein ABHD11 [Plutella xylostella]|nr:protein ABHD11 [Plutella xylostella]
MIIRQARPVFNRASLNARQNSRGLILSYKVIGERAQGTEDPPIMIFHALLGHKKTWEPIAKTFNTMTSRAVVVVDLRNHGESPHTNTHRYPDLSEDIARLCDKLGIPQATMVGHGIGGRAAMYLALTEPERVKSLLVIDVSPISSPSPELYLTIIEAMRNFSLKPYKNPLQAQDAFKKELRPLIPDEYVLNIVVSNIAVKNSVLTWTCNLEVLKKEFQHIKVFPKLKNKQYFGPTLFLGGQLSDFLPPDDLTGIRGYFPAVVVRFVRKTCHNPHLEDPKGFFEASIKFLKLNNKHHQVS